MKEGLLNDLVPESGPGQGGVAGDTAVQPNEMVGGLALTREQYGLTKPLTTGRTEALTTERTDALTTERADALTTERTGVLTTERTDALTTERTEALTTERTEALTTERTDALTTERTEALTTERTEALTREETDDSSNDGLDGTSEGSVHLESKAPSISADSEEHHTATPNCTKDAMAQPKGAGGQGDEEPPVDWLEPLEEDDDEEDDRHSWELDLIPGERRMNGKGEAEEESLAGESERSGSLAGSERNFSLRGNKSGMAVHRRRRRRAQSVVDEEWEDWPILGEGWKRKEVFRRSGFSVGKTDTYYMSPRGHRLRSKIELAKHLAGTIDISTLDFKSGMFLNQGTLRRVKKLKKFRKMSRSVEKRSYSPDLSGSPHRLRIPQHKGSPPPHPPTGRPSSITTPPRPAPPKLTTPPPSAAPLTPPLHHAKRLRPLIKQEAGSPDCTQPELPATGCSRCGGPVAGVEAGKKHKTLLCLKCNAGQRKYESPNIVFRKWLPCRHCRACLLTEDCGMCASCKNARLNHDTSKPVRCRKRKCLCPIRKKTLKEKIAEKEKEKKRLAKLEEQYRASEVSKVKKCSINNETKFELTVCVDGEDEEDKDEAELVQSQRTFHEGWMGLGRPQPHYRYSSHWGKQRKRKELWDNLEFTDDEDDEGVGSAGTPGAYKLQKEADKDSSILSQQGASAVDTEEPGERDETGVTPMISSIFSLADGAEADRGTGVPWEPELQGLLESLRKMALPRHWVGLLVEGPGLQLLQCCKRSTNADTALYIDSGFYYQISVQDQPLPLTHPLYKDHPRRLPTVPHVVALLLDLERYAVCQGHPATPRSQQPFLPTRAAICPFLVLKTEEHCDYCKARPL
ncbi:hypothetical protein SKAU_G00152860 [Synaphobranchus kaupii]|uniref:Methyl-CpG-binding domain protein 1 n=1 Tax=Synaphobranchus kaupii TaxID=118154 RepID=A0A9Q1FH38_SYNKA|nr:hypothetical protein SKAU_G00152860 [Synaphobranchus kaupii]